jgi:hypothetical protein
MIPIVLRFVSLLKKKKPHACDVYGSRDLKYPSVGVLYSFGQFEGLSVETASRDGKCQLLTVDISTGFNWRTVNDCSYYYIFLFVYNCMLPSK